MDWSDGIVRAKVALIKVEHVLALGRWQEGCELIIEAQNALADAHDDASARRPAAPKLPPAAVPLPQEWVVSTPHGPLRTYEREVAVKVMEWMEQDRVAEHAQPVG